MRPGQNNKRMRGRNNNNNRKGPNPLTRSFESNGPDVKIRGTAQHIAEKYLQLARDAQSSGDPVMAESYLQHAEHYYRVITTAQLAQQQAAAGFQGGSRPPADQEMDDDDEIDDISDRFASVAERLPQPIQPAPQPPQPYQGQPNGGQQNYGERQPYQGGDNRNNNNGNRPYRQDGYQGDRPQQNHQNNPNNFRNDQRRFRNDQRPEQTAEPIASEPPAGGLPAFITRPTDLPPPPPEGEFAGAPEAADAHGYHLRPRRRRRGRPGGGEQEFGDAEPMPDVQGVPVSE